MGVIIPVLQNRLRLRPPTFEPLCPTLPAALDPTLGPTAALAFCVIGSKLYSLTLIR
jgi:hypothetical protein